MGFVAGRHFAAETYGHRGRGGTGHLYSIISLKKFRQDKTEEIIKNNQKSDSSARYRLHIVPR
jgi:hypothetical protein